MTLSDGGDEIIVMGQDPNIIDTGGQESHYYDSMAQADDWVYQIFPSHLVVLSRADGLTITYVFVPPYLTPVSKSTA